jgi:hypothetical protein
MGLLIPRLRWRCNLAAPRTDWTALSAGHVLAQIGCAYAGLRALNNATLSRAWIKKLAWLVKLRSARLILRP